MHKTIYYNNVCNSKGLQTTRRLAGTLWYSHTIKYQEAGRRDEENPYTLSRIYSNGDGGTYKQGNKMMHAFLNHKLKAKNKVGEIA